MIVASSMIAPWQADILVWVFVAKMVSLILFGRRGRGWGGGDDIDSHRRRR